MEYKLKKAKDIKRRCNDCDMFYACYWDNNGKYESPQDCIDDIGIEFNYGKVGEDEKPKMVVLNNFAHFLNKQPWVRREDVDKTREVIIHAYPIGAIVGLKSDYGDFYRVAVVCTLSQWGNKDYSLNEGSIPGYGVVFLNKEGEPVSFSAWHSERELSLISDDISYGRKLIRYYEEKFIKRKKTI